MNAPPPTSPTCCRPQHLDRERLRRLLASEDFTKVVYHEAVVVIDAPAAPAFKLLAVTRDALLLFPLGSGGGGSGSPSARPASLVSRVDLCDVVAVDRAPPSQTKLQGVMIHANSELFQVVVETPPRLSPTKTKTAAPAPVPRHYRRTISIATFEPNSRAFFYVMRAFHVEFQRRVLAPEATPDTASDASDHSELPDLLAGLVEELAEQSEDVEARCSLLDELTAAVMCTHTLQKLCFQDQSALSSVITRAHGSGAATIIQTLDYGLVSFVVNELTRISRDSSFGHEDKEELLLEYRLSLLQLLHGLLFGGHCVPERLRFFLHTPLNEWISLVTSVPTINKFWKTEQWRVLTEDLVDWQAAMVLELQLLQEEAHLLDDAAYFQHQTAVAVLLGRDSQQHGEWLAKLTKRVAVLASRTPKEHDLAIEKGGSTWSLALWRDVSVLIMMLRAASSESHGGLSPLIGDLVRRRRDYIDLYLRNPRFGSVLASSPVPHLMDVADNLLEILDLLSI